MYEYGVEKFSFKIIEQCSVREVDDRERFWISYYDSCNPEKGYNKETGGKLAKKNILTEEEKKKIYSAERSEKIRQKLKGRKLSEEHKAATSKGLSQYFKTHEVRHTEESKRNMSEAQKVSRARYSASIAVDPNHPDAQPKVCPHCGSSFSPKKMSPWGIKRHVAKKFCSKKCIMQNYNTNITPETRAKIAKSKSGTRISEEHRRKISEAMKAHKKKSSDDRYRKTK